jgi:hypothetical protein
VEITFTEDESAALQRALHTYLSDLRSEILDTDDRQFRAGLREEREVLEAAVAKLEATRGQSELRDESGREIVRVVTLWWTDGPG